MLRRLSLRWAALAALVVVFVGQVQVRVYAQTFTPPEITTLDTNEVLVDILKVIGVFASVLMAAWVIKMAPTAIAALRRAFR